MKKAIVTFFGIGMIPGMPGTYASLATAALFTVLWLALGMTSYIVAGVLMLVSVGAGFWLCPWAEDCFRKKDPGQLVIDEVAGQLLTLLIVFLLALVLKPMAQRPVAQIAAAFLLFRLFDVVKPWPIRAIEKWPGGWGVVMDDLMAGVYASGMIVLMVYAVRMVVGKEMWGA